MKTADVPDLTNVKLDPAHFPDLDLTERSSRKMPDGTPYDGPRYWPAWNGQRVAAGDIDTGQLISPSIRPKWTPPGDYFDNLSQHRDQVATVGNQGD